MIHLLRINFLLLFCAFSFSLSACSDKESSISKDEAPVVKKADNPVAKNGALAVKGIHLVNNDGNSVQLCGVSFGWHNWWPRFYNKQCVNTLAKDWGCSVVRAAMGVDVDDNKAYLKNKEYATKCVTDVADAAINEGIYVIIDWHCHHALEKEACEFFAKMAQRYKNVPNVMYEIFNEPWSDDYSWQQVKSYAVNVIKSIRSIDKNAIIIVGSPRWDTALKEVSDSPITGYSNIIYSLHFYDGTHKQDLRNVADNAIKKNIPIFVSECGGMNSDGDGPIDKNEWNLWLNWMNKNKISWCAWCIADKNESCSMIKDINVSSTGPWNDNDLKEWGVLVRNILRQSIVNN